MPPLTDCVECGIGMLSNYAWQRLTREERQASGMRVHDGRGLCGMCRRRLREHVAVGRPGRPRVEYKTRHEVYDLWRDYHMSYSEIARTMNIKAETAQRYVERVKAEKREAS